MQASKFKLEVAENSCRNIRIKIHG